MSTKPNQNETEVNSHEIEFEIDPTAYGVKDNQLMQAVDTSIDLLKWAVNELENNEVAGADIDKFDLTDAQIQIAFDVVVAVAPTDIVGRRFNDNKLVFADSISDLAEVVGMSQEFVECETVDKEEARKRLAGDYKNAFTDTTELAVWLSKFIKMSPEKEFGIIIREDKYTFDKHQLLTTLGEVQEATYRLLDKRVYVGVLENGVGVITNDIQRMAELMDMSEYELDKVLISPEEHDETIEGDL